MPNPKNPKLQKTDCPVCHKEEATIHYQLGILPGLKCKARRDNLKSPDSPVEMIGESIKTQRQEYAKSVIQPYRRDELSREYLEAYGTKGISVTDEEVRKAKPVWTDVISPNLDIKKSK